LLLLAAIFLGSTRMSNEGQVASIFFIVMPAILLLVLFFVRFDRRAPAANTEAAPPTPDGSARAATPGAPMPQTFPGATTRETRRQARQTRRAAWHEARAWRVTGPPPHIRFINFVRNFVVGTSVTTLLVIGTAAFMFLAMDVPGMLAAGIPDKDIPAEMTREFGFAQWPQLLRVIGQVVGWGSLMLAAAVLIVSRRNTYGLHILRGTVGVAVFTASLMFLVNAMRGTWDARYVVRSTDVARDNDGEFVMQAGGTTIRMDVESSATSGPSAGHPRRHDDDAERVANAVQRYLDSGRPQAIPMAGGLSLLGLVLICWPARRGRNADVMASDEAVPPTVENA
jgi:hypothetical protein